MRKPRAQTISPKPTTSKTKTRVPQAFEVQKASIEITSEEGWHQETATPAIEPKRPNWVLRIALWAGGLLISLGLSLMADQLIRDLFARYEWLGWAGLGALALFVLAIIILIAREIGALASLSNLDALRQKAQTALETDLPNDAKTLLIRLNQLYQPRADLAKARHELDLDMVDLFDGAAMIHAAERHLMSPLDTRAKALTAASARRVAIVTAISPRAVVDIAFVAYESMKLSRAIATLYGAKPGFFGSWRLAREILAHLAITGGVALGDSLVQQLLGHGLAAKLSARLGEGLVNGLMSVRVGIAAMRVTRPLPFEKLKQPQVMDFMADLANITKGETK